MTTVSQYQLRRLSVANLERESEGGHATAEAILSVEGIHCGRCAVSISKILKGISGVNDVLVNVPVSQVNVSWFPDIVGLDSMLQALDQNGYPAQTLASGGNTELAAQQRRTALKRLLVAGLGMMQVMTFAVALYLEPSSVSGMATEQFLRLVSLMVATPVVFYAGAPFFVNAWHSLKRRQLDMDVPVALAIGIAYTASVASTFLDGEHVYFDSATMFVFLLSVARYFDLNARNNAQARVQAALDVLPATCYRMVKDDAVEIPIQELKTGDVVLVKPGDTIPGDGVLVLGAGEVDESLITGESRPIAKNVGDQVVAGSINCTGVIRVRVESVDHDTVFAAIQRMAFSAQATKPRVGRIADTVAGFFVLGVLVVALTTGLVWFILDPDRMLSVVLSVLVITCPCALSLAVPTSLIAATSALARKGLLLTESNGLETLSKVNHFVLDKTGTLTKGIPRVCDIKVSPASGLNEKDCLSIAASLEKDSGHPYSLAFSDIKIQGAAAAQEIHPGLGILGEIKGKQFRVGTANFAGGSDDHVLCDGVPTHATPIFLGDGKELIARIDLVDDLRTGAQAFVQTLRRNDISVSLASGDHSGIAVSIGRQLGVETILSRQTPEDKLSYIKSLQDKGLTVAMVGDGINDAPILSQADIGITFRNGTNLAQACSAMIVLSESLDPAREAFLISKRTMGTIKANILWAIAYNVITVPLAVSGHIAPWVAAAGMSFSSMFIVANASRLAFER
ncbi:MAG: cation-translocating P-type ATPase [Pseudomonadota bacterium]